jgi:fructose-1-phosphate kinase PfkB-like protein
VAKYIESNNEEQSFILGNAAGMATVSSQWLGTEKMIKDFSTSLEIIKIKK